MSFVWFYRKKSNEGWSFMETLIVITVVLILTSSVGFMGAGSLEKARIASCKSQIDSFCVALEAFYMDCGFYPNVQQGLSALYRKPSDVPDELWAGPYLHKMPPKDPWGNDYEYLVPGGNGLNYGIRSFGQDGMEGGEGKNADITSW